MSGVAGRRAASRWLRKSRWLFRAGRLLATAVYFSAAGSDRDATARPTCAAGMSMAAPGWMSHLGASGTSFAVYMHPAKSREWSRTAFQVRTSPSCFDMNLLLLSLAFVAAAAAAAGTDRPAPHGNHPHADATVPDDRIGRNACQPVPPGLWINAKQRI